MSGYVSDTGRSIVIGEAKQRRRDIWARMQDITLERLCCPCITFAIEFEDERGPIAVRMIGQPGIKPFLLEEFKGKIPDKLPRTA